MGTSLKASTILGTFPVRRTEAATSGRENQRPCDAAWSVAKRWFMATCQSLLTELYLAREGRRSPSGTTLTKAGSFSQVFGRNSFSGVKARRNLSISLWQGVTTRISVAITNFHRSINALTVGYVERKST